ncbi:hypothetical protein BaRGS_00012435 [Batillaria attramentaria]|uniref:Uncharacterized protein n=1 Tax=Batillaria attramentaria TaxID=370345 RepID=A0ABD0LAM1_9CAEN
MERRRQRPSCFPSCAPPHRKSYELGRVVDLAFVVIPGGAKNTCWLWMLDGSACFYSKTDVLGLMRREQIRYLGGFRGIHSFKLT